MIPASPYEISASIWPEKDNDELENTKCETTMKRQLKPILFALTAILASTSLMAQDADTDLDPHKIVIQFTSGDTTVHKMTLRQLNNIITAAPNSTVEVVCHGPGISLLQKSKAAYPDKVADLAGRGILFKACENTMKEKNIDKTDILPSAGFVKAGIIEIVKKQEDGWSYIRAGS